MTTWFGNLWERLRSSYWFVPSIMTVLAIALSFATIMVDNTVKAKVVESLGWIWAGGPEGARELLSTIAGSMITVAGVTFSITIVALSLTSSQFGPRVLRNFMRDTGNQIVLGTFIATFVYCLMVLRTVRTGESGQFVPYISVTTGMALGMVSIGVLIYFIHHVSVSIQASHLIAKVGHELEDAVDRIFPEMLGEGEPGHLNPRSESDIPKEFDRRSRPVLARGSGYLQAIDSEALMNVAKEKALLIRIEHRPGDFIVEGKPLVLAWPEDYADDKLADELNRAFILGRQRTPTEDTIFIVNQIAEVAVRALSPGINDPFTAITCIDWLGSALTRLAKRKLPSPYRYDNAGKLRVITPPVEFSDFLYAAFAEIRLYGRTDEAVMIRLLETLGVIAGQIHREEDRAALLDHANLIKQAAGGGLPEEWDTGRLEEQYRATIKAIEQSLYHKEEVQG